MNPISTVSHVFKAALGNLPSRVYLARGSGGEGFFGRLAMNSIENGKTKFVQDASRCRLSNDQIVARAMKLVGLHNQITPAEGRVGTQMSMATNVLLECVREKCGSQKAIEQLDMVLTREARFKRAMIELGDAFKRGELQVDDSGRNPLKEAASVVAMLLPEEAGNLWDRKKQILDELLTLPLQGGMTLNYGQYQQQKWERFKALAECASDPKYNAKTLNGLVEEEAWLISHFEQKSTNDALDVVWNDATRAVAAFQNEEVQHRLAKAVMSVRKEEA